jgi:putative transposase
MSKQLREAESKDIAGCERMFFVTTGTAGGRSLFQTERMANLFIDVLRNQVRAKKMAVHDFVVMPDHVYILMTLPGDMTIEKAMQLIKGGFSFRAGKELGFWEEIWHRGFSDVDVSNVQSEEWHRSYIDRKPVKAGLAQTASEYPFGSAFLRQQKRAGVKLQPS